MIDKLKYEQVLAIAQDLKVQADIISKLAENKSAQDLIDFAATVEGYSKFLENTIEINRDADKALSELVSHLKKDHS